MSYRITPDDLRAAREQLAQRRTAREAEFAAAKAEMEAQFEADLKEIDAELSEIAVAEKINERWSGSSLVNIEHTPVDEIMKVEENHEGPAVIEPGEDETETQLTQQPQQPPQSRRTQKDLVLEAVRRIDPGRGAFRYEIEQFIMDRYGIVVPPASVSVYLSRLKAAGLVEVVGNVWTPVGGWIK